MTSGNTIPLAGTRAVVTGAGRGIGRSIALALALAGADVAVAARTASDLESLVAEIQQTGSKSLAISSDAPEVEQVHHPATTALEGLGGIGILVNNAGNSGSHYLLYHP